MTAERGKSEGHIITMARPRDIWGPTDSCENNSVRGLKVMKEEAVRHVDMVILLEMARGCSGEFV